MNETDLGYVEPSGYRGRHPNCPHGARPLDPMSAGALGGVEIQEVSYRVGPAPTRLIPTRCCMAQLAELTTQPRVLVSRVPGPVQQSPGGGHVVSHGSWPEVLTRLLYGLIPAELHCPAPLRPNLGSPRQITLIIHIPKLQYDRPRITGP